MSEQVSIKKDEIYSKINLLYNKLSFNSIRYKFFTELEHTKLEHELTDFKKKYYLFELEKLNCSEPENMSERKNRLNEFEKNMKELIKRLELSQSIIINVDFIPEGLFELYKILTSSANNKIPEIIKKLELSVSLLSTILEVIDKLKIPINKFRKKEKDYFAKSHFHLINTKLVGIKLVKYLDEIIIQLKKNIEKPNKFTGISDLISRKMIKEEEINPDFLCPISKALMTDPVIVVKSGQTYENKCISEWLEKSNIDPNTGSKVNKQTIPNITLRNQIISWLEKLENIQK